MLTLLYQPIVELNTERLLGAEILTRVGATSLSGTQPPGPALGALTGNCEFCSAYDSHVLHQAAIRDRAQDHAPLLFWNLWQRSLETRQSCERLLCLMDRLEKSGVLLPEQVVIEFNENTQIVSREVLRFAGQAKKMGFRLALDDQGLDGQDPEIVDALPWDIIKLDWRPMMRSPLSEKAHLEAARRAHWNNMELVVEGIESRQDVERAAALFKPSMLQGYYYLPPSNLRAATNFNARNDFTLPLVYD